MGTMQELLVKMKTSIPHILSVLLKKEAKVTLVISDMFLMIFYKQI